MNPQDLPMPVVLDAEIVARILDRITAEQEAEWDEEASDEEREADRIAALYEEYSQEMEDFNRQWKTSPWRDFDDSPYTFNGPPNSE